MDPISSPSSVELSRQKFVQQSAAVGAGLWAGAAAWADEPVSSQPTGKTAELAIAMIGVGGQGRSLLKNCLKIAGVRFVAICDIWPYHQKYVSHGGNL